MYLLEREWTTAEGKREKCVLIGEGVDHSSREEGTLCIYWRGSGPQQKGRRNTMYLLEREWTTAEGKTEHYVFIGEGVDHSRREEGTLCIYWRGSGPLQKGRGKSVY